MAQPATAMDGLTVEYRVKDTDAPLAASTVAFGASAAFAIPAGALRVHMRFTKAGATVLDLVGGISAQSEPPGAPPKPTPVPCPGT